jgi:ABC-type nitrate/sulfonate/bicarbonate transport system substrate-binding protein
MLYPFMLFKIQGANPVAIQASTHPVIGVTSIMVKTDSPYQTVADLKGKKIARWRASCPYMVLSSGLPDTSPDQKPGLIQYRDLFSSV